MSTKEQILNKIQILITNHFKTPEEAFAFFDEDGDRKLSKNEIKKIVETSRDQWFSKRDCVIKAH